MGRISGCSSVGGRRRDQRRNLTGVNTISHESCFLFRKVQKLDVQEVRRIISGQRKTNQQNGQRWSGHLINSLENKTREANGRKKRHNLMKINRSGEKQSSFALCSKVRKASLKRFMMQYWTEC